ncbi:MAG: mannose-6-phosphate isomerase [Bacteroidia bacterium]|jgi:mannose-6-phosphate isomerase|nr:class I mannose-6-phosphate isomerase [Bacteroidales bacterium]NCD40959.1 mannose-6-phosphate isomerase [Bacteroidia bacterium]MDD2323928.1 mannose-6-phosphate isomerase [Bacteroidales bacterium]MDD3011458.1 mannose-6-phosphate isomerase [Bacteroidales bacterium]MDD3961230.1 mannose-6-phosphate isomerase [Bacteroidales bacterium]
MNTLYPLKFKPIFKDKIWGGQRIRTLLGMDFDPLPNCGEAWLISSYPGNISVVENGFLAGNNLNELIEIYMDDLLGEKVFEKHKTTFPLLIKFIDAEQWLSLQVHPDDALARKYKHPNGKTEMWYVLHSEPGAELISGFSRNSNSQEYMKMLEEKRIAEILNYEPTAKGDVFYMPAGRIHSLGPGNLVAEIQQTSDLTYRIYDWDRVDEQGKGRPLHLNKAMEAINFQVEEAYKTHYSSRQNHPVELVATPYFTANFMEITTPVAKDLSLLDSFVVYLCTEGSGELTSQAGALQVHAGEALLIPAGLDAIGWKPVGKMVLLEVYIP